jgi:type IV secretory pathway VirD2 relaxase
MPSTIMERLALRVPLKVDTEESRLASKMRRAVSKIRARQKSHKGIQEARGGLYSMGARGVYVKDGDLYSRSVIVKARYVKNNGNGFKEKIKDHLDYITRDHAGKDANKPDLFSENESKDLTKNAITDFSESPHNFRFIISPEDGDKIELKDFTKNLIKTIENDLGTKLSWVAACHYDTNEPHVHLVVNGKNDAGEKLLMTRDYISRGIRNRASQIINNKLGLKTSDEVARQLELSASKNAKSSLDDVIQNNIKSDQINLKKIDNKNFDDINTELLERRLSYLATKGLAQKSGEQSWSVKENYLDQLRELNRTSSIIEQLSSKLAISKERCELITPKSLSDKSQTGQVVARGYVNEIDDERYLVVKTEQGKHLYVELEKYSEKSPTKVGDWVRVDATKYFEGPKSSDQSIAQLAQGNGGIYDARSHEEYASQQKKLPPGVSPQEYVQVHLKRLEVLAKMDLATKLTDKKFVIPHNLLENIAARAHSSAQKYQPHIKVTQVYSPTISSPKLSHGLKR